MSLSTSLDDLLGPEEGASQPQQFQQQPQQFQQQPQQQMPQIMSNGNQIVDAILTELESSPEYQQDTNAASQQYFMNPDAHVPPPQLGDTSRLLRATDTKINSVHDLSPKKKSGKFFNDNKKEFIMSAIFFGLMFIMSLHQVNRVIFGFFPGLLLENGQISILGIFLKTLFVTIIFSILAFVI